jgi:lysophospholipase L1-like esterase
MRRARIANVGFAFLALLIALGTMEGLCWMGERFLTPADGRAAVDLLLGREAVIGRVAPHPYMLYVNSPGYESGGYLQHNRDGYRGDVSPCEEPCLKILALGGSTTYGHLLENPKDAWPARLQENLNAAGVRSQVVNGGLNYATTAELLAHWMFRDRYLKPDIVIVHGPGNDALALLFDEYNAEYTSFRKGWTAAPFGRRAAERVLLKSATMRVAYAWWLKLSGIQGILWQPKEFSELTAEEAMENAGKHQPIGFERNLELLLRMIEADGARPVYFEFVYAPKGLYKTALPQAARYVEHIYDPLTQAWNDEAEIARRVASSLEIPFLTLPREELPLEYFLDHCHLDPRGENVKARFLADAILGNFNSQSVAQSSISQ